MMDDSSDDENENFNDDENESSSDDENIALFENISDDANYAIDVFIPMYEKENGTQVLLYDPVVISESFTSIMKRLDLSLSNDKRASVYCKLPQFIGDGYNFAEENSLYDMEEYMYKTIRPRINESWPKDETPPFVYCYVVHTPGILVLENFLESGFRPREKDSLLDLAGAQVVLKSLARFHALSTRLLDDSDLRKELDYNTITNIFSEGTTHPSFDSLPNDFKTHIFPIVGEGVRSVYNHYFADYKSVVKFSREPNTGGLNVILHGDLKSKNILFRNGDCKFIDFQGSRRGSPAMDLLFFLVSNVKFEMAENNLEALLELYVHEFNRMVGESGPRYDLTMLKADFDKYVSYFLHILCSTAIFWTIGSELYPNLSTVLTSERYKSTVKYWLKYFKLE